MPSASNEFGENRIFLCWNCARLYFEKLITLNITEKPDKKVLISKAFRIASKQKQEKW